MVTTTLLLDRWEAIKDRPLLRGAHQPDGEMCVMEAVAYVGGERWSDSPACACPVIGAFMRRWNDDLSDDDRQMLRPYVPRLVGTRRGPATEDRRAWLVTDWMVRVYTPAWLELGGMAAQADALRTLPELRGAADARAANPALQDARTKAAAAWAAAWAAAGAAAGAAARDAAGAAARAAAGAAAGDAAGAAARDAAGAAAGDAAGAAAGDAAGAAARAAARDAAKKRLAPTKASLQQSALALLDRLIACE